MRRRRRRSGLTASLFPFLSVLACVIGTLTLMISALGLGEVAASTRSEQAFEEELAARSARAARDAERARELAAQISALEARIAGARSEQEELDALRVQLQAFGIAPETRGGDLSRAVDRRIEADSLVAQLAALEAQLAELLEAVEDADAELVEVEDDSSLAPIELLPLGIGQKLAPFFVECSADGLRVQLRDGRWSDYLAMGDLVQGGRFKMYLQKIRTVRYGTVIFLIRPSGVDTYKRAVKMAEELYIRNAKLPIPGWGEVDFSRL
ncbi:MAG: hypothetical protein JRG96_08080 [Deltaproteobacteria bacterium]|nr:hypothetical protein [Deltaproteobacteria bacterium]MBW2419327.1 hypothetical protein [Deltaproteobacteria bacterium]